MTRSLKDQTVLLIGWDSGLARAITPAVDAGARVVAARRDQETLHTAYVGEPGISTEDVLTGASGGASGGPASA